MSRESLSITELVREAHTTASEKGFWALARTLPSVTKEDTTWMRGFRQEFTRAILSQKLALIHSEVSEALEVLREGTDPVAFAEELADIVIRTADLAGFQRLDLEQMVRQKLEWNKQRPPKHGKAF